jgi:hypothetical protein
MIATVAQTDAWTATMTRRLESIRAAMLDVIDMGIDETTLPTSRDPSRKEQDATDRRDGRFVPTPSGAAGATRQAGVSRPTENRVLAQEGAVQALTTHLYELCAQVEHSLVGEFGLELDEIEPPTIREDEATYLRPSRTVVDLDVRACRRWTLDATFWLENVAGELAGVWLAAEGDQADRVRGHATWFGTAVGALSRRLTPKARECACGCGEPAPVGGGATRSGCRVRAHRAKKAS